MKGHTMTKRRDTYNYARDMARTPEGLRWLLASNANPNKYMTPFHIRVIKAAIRDIHPKIKF